MLVLAWGKPTTNHPNLSILAASPFRLDQLAHADFNLDIFKDYDAVLDTPVVPFYKDFDRMFPGSHFFLHSAADLLLTAVSTELSDPDHRKGAAA